MRSCRSPRGGQPGGVFPRLGFSPAPPAQSCLGSVLCGSAGSQAPFHPAAGGDLPGAERGAQELSRSRLPPQPGTHTPASPRSALRTRRCPKPSSTVGASVCFGGAGKGGWSWEDFVWIPKGGEEEKLGSSSPRRQWLGEPSVPGLAPTCPGAAGGTGAFPARGARALELLIKGTCGSDQKSGERHTFPSPRTKMQSRKNRTSFQDFFPGLPVFPRPTGLRELCVALRPGTGCKESCEVARTALPSWPDSLSHLPQGRAMQRATKGIGCEGFVHCGASFPTRHCEFGNLPWDSLGAAFCASL